jgi:hypothetical protein
MSLRASASLPSSCSGAMYWNVPRIVPRDVSGWLSCRRRRQARRLRGRVRRRRELREAEVEQLHAGLRQHDVAGLEVAVDDALPVRRVERARDLDADAQRLFERHRSAPSRSASVSPSSSSMTR